MSIPLQILISVSITVFKKRVKKSVFLIYCLYCAHSEDITTHKSKAVGDSEKCHGFISCWHFSFV